MKRFSKILTLLMLGFVGCNPLELQDIPDPNNPSLNSVQSNATRNQIQFLVTGLEFRHRAYFNTVTQAFNTFGREIWFLNSSDPRFQTDWLGQGNRQPDGNFFGFGTTGGGAYAAPYQAIRQAYSLLDAVENTSSLTEQEKNAVKGFAKTIMGYQFMIPANLLYGNGIRIDVKDIQNPGPYVSYQEALTFAEGLLDQGLADLTSAGLGTAAFPFTLTAGWNGFNTYDGLKKVNRAIAARLNAYQNDWQGVLNALNASFINIDGNLNDGPSHVYLGPPDVFNPIYYIPQANIQTIIVPHPTVLRDTITGDRRVANKFLKRTIPVTVSSDEGSLIGTHQDKRWPSNTSPVPFIRNEELILLKAEAHAQLDQTTEALSAINRIRTVAQIGNYAGPTAKNDLINEILFQRRYSLWCEPWGHRWIDARRYNKLSEIQAAATATDRGTVFTQFPRPQADVNWDLYVGN